LFVVSHQYFSLWLIEIGELSRLAIAFIQIPEEGILIFFTGDVAMKSVAVRRARVRVITLLLFLLCGAQVVMAQGLISQGAASWAVGADHFDGTPEADLVGINPVPLADHVAQSGWFYRVSGDAAESFMPVPDVQSYVANAVTLDWINVNGQGFDATEIQSLTNIGNGFRLQLTFRVRNSSGASMTLDLFHALDMDLNGTAGDDAGVLAVANSEITISDGGTITGRYRAVGNTNYVVRAAGGGTDAIGLLNDGDVDNYDNTGLPFVAGDVTMGFQWAGLVIPDGVQTQVVADIFLIRPPNPPAPQPITAGYIPNNSSGRGSAFFSDVAPPVGTNNHRIRVRDEAGNLLHSAVVPYGGGTASGVTDFNLPLADANPHSWETGIQVIVNPRNGSSQLGQLSISYVGHASTDMVDFIFNTGVVPATPPGVYASTLTDDRPTGALSHYQYDVTRRVFSPQSSTQVAQATHGILGPFSIKVDHATTPIVMPLPVVVGQQMYWVRSRASFKNSAGINLGRFDIAPKSPNLYAEIIPAP